MLNRNNRLHTRNKNHVYKEGKETTYARISERNIHQHIGKISTIYVNNGHKTQGTRINVSQIERKENIQVILTTSLNMHSPPNKNLLY